MRLATGYGALQSGVGAACADEPSAAVVAVPATRAAAVSEASSAASATDER